MKIHHIIVLVFSLAINYAYAMHYTSQELQTFVREAIREDVADLRQLFPIVLRINDIEAAQQLLPRCKVLFQAMPFYGDAWLCLAAGKGFSELADLLVSAGAKVENAFKLSLESDLEEFIQNEDKPFSTLFLRMQCYLAPKLPAQQFFEGFKNWDSTNWFDTVILNQIRLNTRQQKEEFVDYLQKNPYVNDTTCLLTSDISHNIMRKKVFYCFSRQQVEEALFLAIWWHENDFFHQLFEKHQTPTLIDSTWYAYSLFEWAIICRNMALAKDIFLLGGGCALSREEIIDMLQHRYWNSQVIDEFMGFVDGVRELQAVVP